MISPANDDATNYSINHTMTCTTYVLSHIRIVHSVAFCFSLISAGYGLEDIADAIINANKIKCQRMDSLRDWNGPLDFLSGAVETTGAAFKAMDVLGVGAATGKAVKGVGKNMSAAMGGMTRIAGSAIPALKKRSPSTPAC